MLETCRLCFSTKNDQYLYLFSDIGIELKICEIIAEHFKYDVSEADSFSNFVCQECWFITKAFHELYQKSRLAQDNFLNPTVKSESDTTDINALPVFNLETEQEVLADFSKENPVDVSEIKMESDSFECGTNLDDLETNFDHLDNMSDSDTHVEPPVLDYKTDNQREKPSKTDTEKENQKWSKPEYRRKIAKEKKQLKNQYDRLFAENKHHLNLTCDNCPTVFETLDDAQNHYANEHNNPMGHIRCCDVKLTNRSEIQNHIRHRHLNPHNFKCSVCEKSYRSNQSLRMHMRTHSKNEKKFNCDTCNKTFSSKILLKKHLNRHIKRDSSNSDGISDKFPEIYRKFMEENFDMSCDVCDAVFISLLDARSHYKLIHNDDTGYVKCCNIKFRLRPQIMDHINTHWNPNRFKCDHCDKTFSSSRTLKKHRQTYSRRYICDMCGRSFGHKDTILRHFFTAHNTSEPQFGCEICHKRFRLAGLLKTHMYGVHRDKKPTVTCEICGRSFYTNFHLNKHMLTHSDKSDRLIERKQCEHCGEWVMTKSGIYYHKQIHTSGVQKCKYCDAELANKAALQGHIRKYHRERKFKCSYCEKAYSTHGDMKKHEEFHTRHNQYPCHFCAKVFTVPSSRQTHIRRNHLEEHRMRKEQAKKNLNNTVAI